MPQEVARRKTCINIKRKSKSLKSMYNVPQDNENSEKEENGDHKKMSAQEEGKKQ